MANYDKTGIKMAPAICPQCAAQLELDPTREKAFCEYCGTQFVVENAINNYKVENATVEHVDSINIIKKGAVESVLNFVENQQRKKEDEERRRREEQQRKEEEQKRKEEEEKRKKDEFLRKYWWVILLAFVVLFALMTIGSAFEQGGINEVRVNVSSSDLEGDNYKDVVKELQDVGFTNIQTEKKDDLIIGLLTKDGEVEQVEIDGSTVFSSDSKFAPDAKIIVTYHTFPENESEST